LGFGEDRVTEGIALGAGAAGDCLSFGGVPVFALKTYTGKRWSCKKIKYFLKAWFALDGGGKCAHQKTRRKKGEG
jgi:hypothetical protein